MMLLPERGILSLDYGRGRRIRTRGVCGEIRFSIDYSRLGWQCKGSMGRKMNHRRKVARFSSSGTRVRL